MVEQQGILDVFWQRPITDVGYMGPDKGEGGKYLLLPPDHEGETPKGWFTFWLYSPTEPFFDQSWKPGDFEKNLVSDRDSDPNGTIP